ncbi:MAG TPA: phenylacetate--CoA ligase [Firmicutes bacterium]|nr:phenylacetate--CoA ligase [Bacillota bacterium]
MPREQLETLQARRLSALVGRAAAAVPFYREGLAKAGIHPGDIRSLEDLRHLPFTTKKDLRDNYPYGLFAVPLREVVRIHASSGTTGKPTVVGYTQHDLDTWQDLMARALTAVGVTRDSVVQVAYGYGLFTGGLGIHYGAERIGASVIPISGGNTKRQVMLAKDFGTTTLACTPSYALTIAEALAELEVDPADLQLQQGVFGAEPWTNAMRREIESRLGLRAFDIYGLSEVIGPGVAIECNAQAGLHVFEDHFLVEVVDPATGEPLPYGEKGELVFTTLTKEALPVIRYRTGDLSVLHPERCACGRTFVRMEKVKGRTDDMLIIRGVNVFPSQVEAVLLELGATEPHYQLVVDRTGTLDEVEVWVEVPPGFPMDEVRRLEELERRVRAALESVLGISLRVKLVEPHTIPRSEGKAKRIVDRRELYESQ